MTEGPDSGITAAIAEELTACRQRGIERLDVRSSTQSPVLIPTLERLATEYLIVNESLVHGRIAMLKRLLRDAIQAFTVENEPDALLVGDLLFGDSANRVTMSAGELLDIARRKYGYRSEVLFRRVRQDAFRDFAAFILVFVSNATREGSEPFDNPASAGDFSAERASNHNDARASLLFRVYIPSERLYAAEASRLLSLFRDWLIKTRGLRIRQAGYRTASGELYEFFADPSVVAIDLPEQLDHFSAFLAACADDPSTAADMLPSTILGRAASSDLITRFGREVRRLQVDLRHERERRILSLRHSTEEQLVEEGIDLRAVPSGQINVLLESLIPGSSATESLALLAEPRSTPQVSPVSLTINQQIISAMESTIVQNVEGTVHLGPQAREILALIDRFGAQETTTLMSSVHELEDADAPAADRSAAKRRLRRFLRQLAGTVEQATLNIFEKYLESKMGI